MVSKKYFDCLNEESTSNKFSLAYYDEVMANQYGFQGMEHCHHHSHPNEFLD